jgi:hypothetical protein
MHHLFGSDARASAFRTLLRAAVVIATAFGLDLDPQQVAAIQLGIEALLQFGRSWYTKAV